MLPLHQSEESIAPPAPMTADLGPGQVQHGGQGGQEAGQHQAEAVPRRGRGRAVGGLVIDQAAVTMGCVIYISSIHIDIL